MRDCVVVVADDGVGAYVVFDVCEVMKKEWQED